MIARPAYEKQIKEDLDRKMVFLGGPRQVGKTTLSLGLVARSKFQYLNWDIDEQRSIILNREFTPAELLIFDEIHKFRRWRNYLKGLYDSIKTGSSRARKILVTGSARLDYYRFSGDSLQGRYQYLRLLPLTFHEIGGKSIEDLKSLYRFSGFPEPFVSQNSVEVKRWSNQYSSRLVREEVASLENLKNLTDIQLLMTRLPVCVASPLSVNNLREDLQVAHKTVEKWIQVLERVYFLFRIPPMGGPKIRSVRKEQKAYLYDWTRIDDPGARFENMIALHLLKYAYWLEDTEGRDIELRFFRDSDGREVDFVLMENGKPTLFVECKLADKTISPHLRYLKKKYPEVPAWQLSLEGRHDFQTTDGIRVCNAIRLLADLR